MRSAKWYGLVVCASLGAACGAQNGAADAANDGEAGAGSVSAGHGAEPTGKTSEALTVDGDGDRPMVANIGDLSGGQYVDAIDKNGNLREQYATLTPDGDSNGGFVVNWGEWTTIDTGLQRTPTMHFYPDDGAIDMYAMGRPGDGKLYEYLRRYSGDSISSWDVSTDSGFGTIADSPVIVAWGAVGSVTNISVAVTSTADGGLYTIDWDPTAGWTINPVWNGSTQVQTTHTIQSYNRDPDNNTPGSYFAGRGLSATDTTTGWVAYRPNGQFGTSFTVLTTFSGASSSPYVWGDDQNGGMYVYAVFGSQLKYAQVRGGALSWHVASNCSPAGSPTWNSIRGTNGHLQLFTGTFNNNTFGCSDLGEGLSSSPYAIFGSESLIYYRGTSGNLWAKMVEDNSTEYLDHWNLGIALP